MAWRDEAASSASVRTRVSRVEEKLTGLYRGDSAVVSEEGRSKEAGLRSIRFDQVRALRCRWSRLAPVGKVTQVEKICTYKLIVELSRSGPSNPNGRYEPKETIGTQMSRGARGAETHTVLFNSLPSIKAFCSAPR